MATNIRPLLLLSLPNSGTTWLCNTISKYRSGKFCDEFFNPVFAHADEITLREHIGSELVSAYRNIALPPIVGFDDMIKDTWGKADFIFTKENFSPFKIEAFSKHFKCVILVRDTNNLFPPSRVRVWSFYEHAWFALKEAGWNLKAISTRDRSKEAHSILKDRMYEDAFSLGLPIIKYSQLFGNVEQLIQVLEKAFGNEGWEKDCAIELCKTKHDKRLL